MNNNNRILIVDDEKSIRLSLTDELEDEGYRVSTAANGEEAFKLLAEEDFDLVITDLVMEGIDGIEVLKKAKTLDPVLSVLILTGYGNLETAIAALRKNVRCKRRYPSMKILFRFAPAARRSVMTTVANQAVVNGYR